MTMSLLLCSALASAQAQAQTTATVGLDARGAAAAHRAPRDRPNVVMLFVDDLGYGDPGFNGHPTTHSPNLNKLAYGGKVLSTWYSGCPVCSCSRASLPVAHKESRKFAKANGNKKLSHFQSHGKREKVGDASEDASRGA